MGEMEKNVMCVLLRSLVEKNLITQDLYDKAEVAIHESLDGQGFFCCYKAGRKEDSNGHAQNSC